VANDLWNFCPKYLVPRTKPPQANPGMSMNGWAFASKPKVPYQKTFVVKLQGMRWYLLPDDTFDEVTNPEYNARLLEKFYEAHGVWQKFDFPHPHFGILECKFSQPLEVPLAIPNSGGLIDAFEVTLVHNNPGY
jgi:hypothetical protein